MKVIRFFFLLFYLSLQRSQKTRREEEKGPLSNSGLTLLLERRGGKSGYTSNFHGIPTTLIIFLGQVCLFIKGQNKRRGITRPLYFVREYTKQNESWSNQNSPFGFQVAGISQRIDPRIVEKIQALAGDGVRDVNEMKRHIRVYVKSLFPGRAPPPKSNKRFCPSKSTLKNDMYNAIIKQRLAKVDQANLVEKIKVW